MALLVGAYMIWLGGSIGLAVLFGSSLVLVVVGVSILFAKIETRNARQRLASFQAGKYLVHWQYTWQEWQKFTENEARKSPLKALQWFLIMSAMTVAIVVLWLLMGGPKKPSDNQKLVGLVFGMPAIGLLGSIATYVYYWQLTARRRKKIDEVYFDGLGIYQDDGYLPLTQISTAKLEGGHPPVIQFTGSRGSGRSSSYYEVRVAVPAGKEEEARKIVEIYSARPNKKRAELVMDYYHSRKNLETAPVEQESPELSRVHNLKSPYRLNAEAGQAGSSYSKSPYRLKHWD
jgi:hypothetical protein